MRAATFAMPLIHKYDAGGILNSMKTTISVAAAAKKEWDDGRDGKVEKVYKWNAPYMSYDAHAGARACLAAYFAAYGDDASTDWASGDVLDFMEYCVKKDNAWVGTLPLKVIKTLYLHTLMKPEWRLSGMHSDVAGVVTKLALHHPAMHIHTLLDEKRRKVVRPGGYNVFIDDES
jgi:hypothetical protein